MAKNGTALRKRQEISKANRIMFLWIAAVSVVVGVSVVLIAFLGQKIWFNEKVINEKSNTVNVLESNLSSAEQLRQSINELNTNQDLMKVRLSDSSPAVQTVLDALPAKANATALASSLQTKLLTGIQGVNIETITVESGDEGSTDSTDNSEGTDETQGSIGFTFTVFTNGSDYKVFKQVFERLERSIRPINVTNVTLESQGDKISMTVAGVSYFENARSVELKDKVVKP
jgi:hypothetical protein